MTSESTVKDRRIMIKKRRKPPTSTGGRRGTDCDECHKHAGVEMFMKISIGAVSVAILIISIIHADTKNDIRELRTQQSAISTAMLTLAASLDGGSTKDGSPIIIHIEDPTKYGPHGHLVKDSITISE